MKTQILGSIILDNTLAYKLDELSKDMFSVSYNKEIFDQAGVAYPTDDWTFEDFRKTCEDLQAAGLPDGVYPTAINRNSGQTTYDAAVFANGWIFLK